jgi:fibronectin type 3 domain-containing protein
MSLRNRFTFSLHSRQTLTWAAVLMLLLLCIPAAAQAATISNISLPALSGLPEVGQTLTASDGTWTNPPTSYSYQWQASTNGTTWTSATGAGATTNSYTIPAADLNSTLRIIVTATDATGSASSTSSATTAVLATEAPDTVTPPQISGSANVESILDASTGTWSRVVTSYSYQWQSSPEGLVWVNVGTDSLSYTIPTADLGNFLRVIVTATNAGGSNSAVSAATTKVLPPLAAVTSAPQITGTLAAGQVLAASTGSWTNTPTSYVYQWETSPDGGAWTPATGAGAATNSYTVQAADLAGRLRVTVAAVNAAGTSAPAPSSSLPLAPANNTAPVVSGTPTVGQALTASNGTWSGSPTSYSYQWQSSANGTSGWTDVAGATSNSYTTLAGDANGFLRITVTATNPGGSTAATSAASAKVMPLAPPPPPIVTPPAPPVVTPPGPLATGGGSSGTPPVTVVPTAPETPVATPTPPLTPPAPVVPLSGYVIHVKAKMWIKACYACKSAPLPAGSYVYFSPTSGKMNTAYTDVKGEVGGYLKPGTYRISATLKGKRYAVHGTYTVVDNSNYRPRFIAVAKP